MEPALRVLLDKQEITEVLLRWCRGIDRGDEELLASCYHPDAVDEHGMTLYTGENAGPGYVQKHLKAFRRHTHFTLNPLIEVEGDRATVESYMIAALIMVPEGSAGSEILQTAGGRYFDRFECRDRAWRILHRHFVVEWQTTQDALSVHAWRDLLAQTGTHELLPPTPPYTGRRSKEDLSYEYV